MLSLIRIALALSGAGDAAVADDIGVADDGAGEIARAQPVDRVRVPDAADVEPVADSARAARRAPTGSAPSSTTFEAATPGGLSNWRPPPAPKRKPLRGTSAASAAAPRGAELLVERGVAQQALRLVPVGEAADEDAVADQVGPPRGQPLAGDPLRAHEAGRGAVVVERERAARRPAGRACRGTACSTSRTSSPCRRGSRGCSADRPRAGGRRRRCRSPRRHALAADRRRWRSARRPRPPRR